MRDYILIAAALIISLGALFFGIQGKSDKTDEYVTRTITQITTTQDKLRDLYQYQDGHYGTAVMSATMLMNQGAYHPSMRYDASTFHDAWGGNITITGATDQVYHDYDKVSQAACNALMTKIGPGSGVVQIGVGTTLGSPTTTVTVPGTVSAANTACTTGNNAMRFIMQ